MSALQEQLRRFAIAATLLCSAGMTWPVVISAQEDAGGRDLPLVWVLSTGGTIAGRGDVDQSRRIQAWGAAWRGDRECGS
jgi:L-asparaginase/Glu-tRNA(Gln) amidotransferase subunit D